METIVGLIDRVLQATQDEAVLTTVGHEVNELMEGRALFNA
jgi:glycine/serine hydroxymethyltransferase